MGLCSEEGRAEREERVWVRPEWRNGEVGEEGGGGGRGKEKGKRGGQRGRERDGEGRRGEGGRSGKCERSARSCPRSRSGRCLKLSWSSWSSRRDREPFSLPLSSLFPPSLPARDGGDPGTGAEREEEEVFCRTFDPSVSSHSWRFGTSNSGFGAHSVA